MYSTHTWKKRPVHRGKRVTWLHFSMWGARDALRALLRFSLQQPCTLAGCADAAGRGAVMLPWVLYLPAGLSHGPGICCKVRFLTGISRQRKSGKLVFKIILSWAVVLNKQTAAGSPWQLQENLSLFFTGEKCIFCVSSSCAVNAVQHQDFHGDGGIAYCWSKDVNLKQKYDWSQNAAQGARHCYAKKYVFQPSATAMEGCHC